MTPSPKNNAHLTMKIILGFSLGWSLLRDFEGNILSYSVEGESLAQVPGVCFSLGRGSALACAKVT